MKFWIIKKGKAKDVFKLIAMAAVADRLLEMKFGKRLIVKNINRN